MTCLLPSVQISYLHKSIHICVYSYMHANIPLASNCLFTYMFQCLNTSSTYKLNVSLFSERTCTITETLSNKDQKFISTGCIISTCVYYLFYLLPSSAIFISVSIRFFVSLSTPTVMCRYDHCSCRYDNFGARTLKWITTRFLTPVHI